MQDKLLGLGTSKQIRQKLLFNFFSKSGKKNSNFFTSSFNSLPQKMMRKSPGTRARGYLMGQARNSRHFLNFFKNKKKKKKGRLFFYLCIDYCFGSLADHILVRVSPAFEHDRNFRLLLHSQRKSFGCFEETKVQKVLKRLVGDSPWKALKKASKKPLLSFQKVDMLIKLDLFKKKRLWVANNKHHPCCSAATFMIALFGVICILVIPLVMFVIRGLLRRHAPRRLSPEDEQERRRLGARTPIYTRA